MLIKTDWKLRKERIKIIGSQLKKIKNHIQNLKIILKICTVIGITTPLLNFFAKLNINKFIHYLISTLYILQITESL